MHERTDNLVVHRTRIHLSHGTEYLAEPEVLRDERFELLQLRLVAVKKIQHVLRGSHRPLDSAKREIVGGRPHTP